MVDKVDKPGREIPEQAETLSATGMFLRAFESNPQPSGEPQASASPLADERGPAEAPKPMAGGPPTQPGEPSSQPGEFTRMFQAAGSGSGAAPTSAERATPAPPVQQPSASAGPGEFTRIFAGGRNSGTDTPATHAEESPRPVAIPPAAPARSKGFSTPGASDSASGGGSFTQFLKSVATSAPPSTSQPQPAPAPTASLQAEGFPARNRETSPPREPSAPSVTGLISSLASPPAGRADPSQAETAVFRSAGPGSFAPAPAQHAERPADAGGVTRLIRQLSQEQATVSSAPPPPPAVAAAPPPSSGPGEFTRMISKLSVDNASAAAPPAPAPIPPPAPPGPAPFQMAAPAVSPVFPPAPAAPAMQAPPAIAAPQIPKPAPAPVPAPAPPKGKLESMVPILLVINTFLLAVLLVVVLFLLKAK